MPEIETIFEEYSLRKTAFRGELLSLFLEVRSSLTPDEIHQKLGKTWDKATIYRGLDLFQANGLIHRVPDRRNMTRFALCGNIHSSGPYIQEHAHFICEACHETFCLHHVKVPQDAELDGHQIDRLQLTFKGVCNDCLES